MIDDETLCMCSHIFAEHDFGEECLGEFAGKPCSCVYFEEDEDYDD